MTQAGHFQHPELGLFRYTSPYGPLAWVTSYTLSHLGEKNAFFKRTVFISCDLHKKDNKDLNPIVDFLHLLDKWRDQITEYVARQFSNDPEILNRGESPCEWVNKLIPMRDIQFDTVDEALFRYSERYPSRDIWIKVSREGKISVKEFRNGWKREFSPSQLSAYP